MKKLTLLGVIFVFCLISNVSLAQHFSPKFGFKGGMSNSTQSVDLTNDTLELLYERDNRYRAGYTFGVFTDFLWYKYITVGTGLDFFQKGHKLEITVTSETGQVLGTDYVTYNQNYLIWNLYAKISPPGLERVHPYVIIAPRLDFFLGYKWYFAGDQEANVEDYVLERYKKVSPSVSFGAGVEINKIIPYSIILEFMYVPDLTAQFNENGNKFWNTAYSISAGLKF
ncbi:MAG TPA: outer membrane beta-barrel protein [Ignavibacteria bacterium]|nr:outer membrane beta-barrel protein [Ignavibacteria bacterium]